MQQRRNPSPGISAPATRIPLSQTMIHRFKHSPCHNQVLPRQLLVDSMRTSSRGLHHTHIRARSKINDLAFSPDRMRRRARRPCQRDLYHIHLRSQRRLKNGALCIKQIKCQTWYVRWRSLLPHQRRAAPQLVHFQNTQPVKQPRRASIAFRSCFTVFTYQPFEFDADEGHDQGNDMSARPAEPANSIVPARPILPERPIVLAKVKTSIDHLFNDSPSTPTYQEHIEIVSDTSAYPPPRHVMQMLVTNNVHNSVYSPAESPRR